MIKTEMTQLLRSVGVNENTVTAMENAYDMGVEFERERIFAELHRMHENASSQHNYYLHAVMHIRSKGNP
jgi:hypothetical protein